MPVPTCSTTDHASLSPRAASPETGADIAFELALALTTERGWPAEWRPAPHHDGVACAVIDAVMSPHVRSETVAGVIQRYQRLHSRVDGPAELCQSFSLHGEQWPNVIGTRNRAWRSRSAPLKSDVIASAAELLQREHVWSASHLLDRAHDPRLRESWAKLPGQATGATWRHLLLVAGFPEPMVCALTRRFLRRHVPAIANSATDEEIVSLMADTARTLSVPVEQIDHQMWRAGARGRPAARLLATVEHGSKDLGCSA